MRCSSPLKLLLIFVATFRSVPFFFIPLQTRRVRVREREFRPILPPRAWLWCKKRGSENTQRARCSLNIFKTLRMGFMLFGDDIFSVNGNFCLSHTHAPNTPTHTPPHTSPEAEPKGTIWPCQAEVRAALSIDRCHNALCCKPAHNSEGSKGCISLRK